MIRSTIWLGIAIPRSCAVVLDDPTHGAFRHDQLRVLQISQQALPRQLKALHNNGFWFSDNERLAAQLELRVTYARRRDYGR